MADTPAVVIGKAIMGLTVDASTSPVNGNTTPQAVAAALHSAQRRIVTVPLITDVGTAANAVGESVCFVAQVPCVVRAVRLSTGIAVTANNSNYATFLVQKRPTSAPGTPVTVATNTTQITDPVLGANTVAFQSYLLTLSATGANLTLAVGDVLTMSVTKTGTGVAIGAAATASGASCGLDITVEEI